MRRVLVRIRGLTLLDTIMGIALFLVVGVAVFQGYLAILSTYQTARIKTVAVQLGSEEIELVRNMPFSQVGLTNGIPRGVLASSSVVVRDAIKFQINRYVRNVDDPFDGTLGGVPDDLSPADYKVFELEIVCVSCTSPEVFRATARVAPKNLETDSDNGALFVRAIDASGVPVSGALVEIENPTLNPPVSISDTTGTDGWLRVVDVPPAVQSYEIEVTQHGFSRDQTYATSTSNPNPTKPHSTVALQTVTQVTFSIDAIGQLNFASSDEACVPIGNVDFDLIGSKLIGTNPDVLKYDQSHVTGGAGALSVSSLEWGTYSLAVTDAAVSLAGSNPLFPLTLNPGVTQNVALIVRSSNPNELVVTVTDSATGLPLSDAQVDLGGVVKTTGVGFLSQTDWSGGAGQENYVDPTRYFTQDGNIDASTPVGEIKLIEIAPGTYATNGNITSSTFDTGSPAAFRTISWSPSMQPPDAGLNSVQLQLATASTSNPTAWNYLGPDGTSDTFYTLATPDINGIHTGDQYLRYKLYLNTASTTFTPSVSDFSFTYTADCVPSGQVYYGGLAFDTFTLDVTKSGYQPYSDTVIITSTWQEKVVHLIHE